MTGIASPGSVGYSQLDPSVSSSEFNAIAFQVSQMIALLDTMKLAQVITVHPGTGTPPTAGTVDVQLLVNQVDGAIPPNSTPNAIVYGLPYFRLQGGPWAIVCDPAVKDIGYVVCSDRDISNAIAAVAGGNPPQVNPGSSRQYNVADGIFVNGVLNAAPKAWLWLKSDGTFNLTDKPGNVVSSATGGITLTPASGGTFEVKGTLKVDQLETGAGGLTLSAGNLTVSAGNITASGSITAGAGGADSVGLQTHTHTQAVDSAGDVEAPTSAPTAGT